MIYLYALVILSGIFAPRAFTYFFAVPFLGAITGCFIWSVLAFVGFIPFAWSSFFGCNLAGAVFWAWMFHQSN